MKKALVWILVFALISVASVLGTIAYLTDYDYADNVMTIGDVNIALLEYERIDTETKDVDAKVQEFHDNKPLLPAVIANGFNYTPGDTYVDWTQSAVGWKQDGENGYTSPIWNPAKINNEVDKMVFVKNTGAYSAYVRTYFAFEAGSFETFDEFQKMIHLNLNADGGWKWEWLPFPAENADGDKYFIAKATYKEALAPNNFTDITLSQIALDSSAINKDVAAFGDTYEVCVNTQAIQSAGFTDPNTALDEGFGRDIPFENLKLVAGIDLKTALHNLNGNKSTPITTKVTSVTFGLNKDLSDEVSGYEGTLTSDEQDVPVYTYYVENGSNYDLYVLADSAIYTPNDSKGLFQGMTSLTTVKTTNMDVSRTENMTNMFRECSALVDINVSAWKLSNATNMTSMFVNCSKLDNLNVRNWNVSNVTSMNSMFYGCNALTHLDVSSWDVGKCTGMKSMFYMCEKLGNLNVSGWDVSQVTTMTYMFRGCQAMTRIDLSDWDVQKVEDMSYMFAFSQDENPSLTELILTGWETTSLKYMEGMFHTCKSLKSIDVSDIDTQNVTNMTTVFKSCLKIEEIIGLENWDTSNVETMKEMFRFCGEYGTNGEWGGNLRVLDLSSFNTSKVTDVSQMFNCCDRLQTIYVGDGWDMSKVTGSDGMFGACGALVGGANTAYSSAHTDATYAHVDGGTANPGYLTHIDDKPAESEQN